MNVDSGGTGVRDFLVLLGGCSTDADATYKLAPCRSGTAPWKKIRRSRFNRFSGWNACK
jgi:hypothetical protein